jgi:hypothetical protein
VTSGGGATSASVSDFDFIMTTILRQRTNYPLRKAFLRDGINDIGDIIALGGRCIARLKFPDDSSGIVVLEKLDDSDQQLIHCFVAFVANKIDDGNPMHSDWQNLAEITKFQEYKIIGYASHHNAWCCWCNVSCNETHNASYNASYNALDDDRDTDRFDLNDDNGITPVVIPSEPSRLNSGISSSADDLFEQHVGIDSRLSASTDDLKSRKSSSVVDCCVDLDNDNGIAVVVAADPIPNDAKDAVMDPLDEENVAADSIPNDVDEEDASGQVKPIHEPYPLDYRVSSSGDDIFLDYHDVGVADDNDIFLDDHDGVVADDSITTEPPYGLDSRVSSSSADDLFKRDDGTTDWIPSGSAGLGSCQSRSADDIVECDDGITDSMPSEPAGLGSRPSASVADLFDLGDDTLDALDGEDFLVK